MSDCMCFGFTKWYYEKVDIEVKNVKDGMREEKMLYDRIVEKIDEIKVKKKVNPVVEYVVLYALAKDLEDFLTRELDYNSYVGMCNVASMFAYDVIRRSYDNVYDVKEEMEEEENVKGIKLRKDLKGVKASEFKGREVMFG